MGKRRHIEKLGGDNINFEELNWECIVKEAELYIKLRNQIKEDYENYSLIQNETWHLYKQFYKLYHRSEKWLEKYKNMLDKYMPKKIINFETIINELSEERVEASFTSKLLHTVDNSKPIYDSNVRYALTIGQVIGKKNDIRKNQAIIIYKKIEDFYKNKKYINIRNRLVIEFNFRTNDKFNITNEKKIDFILWELGKERRFLWELELK